MRTKTFILISLAVVSSAYAQSFATDFEAPAYSVGALIGQNSWVGGGTSVTPSNDALVTNNKWFGPAASGQSALFNMPGTGGTWRTNSQALALGNNTSALSTISFSAQVFVDPITAASADRYFGLQIGSSNSPTATVVGIALDLKGQLRGGYGYSTASTGFNGGTTGVLQTRSISDFTGRWVKLEVVADRSQTTNNVTFTFSGLGTSGGSATETFVKSYNFGSGPGTSNVTHFSMVADWVTGAAAGSAYFDDVQIQAVPEPATMTLLALGALATRRRKKA